MQHGSYTARLTRSRLTKYWGIASISLTTLLLQPYAMASPGDLTEQDVIVQVFLTDTPLPGADAEEHEALIEIRDGAVAWLGDYQGVRSETDYLIIEFENGEVPVTVAFKDNGELEAIGTSCPVTEVPLSQAPEEFQAALAECPDLVP